MMSTWVDDLISSESPWEIFTALRYDPALQASNHQQQSCLTGSKSAFYLSDFHRQRLIKAAKHFGWTECVTHTILRNSTAWEQCLTDYVHEFQRDETTTTVDRPLKVRIAMINPAIVQRCHQQHDAGTINNQSMKNYIKQIQHDKIALERGIHVSISAVPPRDVNQLFPATLNMSSKDRQAQSHQFVVVVDATMTTVSTPDCLKTFPRDIYDAATARMKTALSQPQTATTAITATVKAAPKKDTDNAPHENDGRDEQPIAMVQSPKKHIMNEILLCNARGEITEGSFTNVYFYRDGRWITPPASASVSASVSARREHEHEHEQHADTAVVVDDAVGQLLPGAARAWALAHNLAIEQVVHRNDVKLCEEVWLSNGVRGFVPGVITVIV